MENMQLYAQLRGMNVKQHTDLFDGLLEFTHLGSLTGVLESFQVA